MTGGQDLVTDKTADLEWGEHGYLVQDPSLVNWRAGAGGPEGGESPGTAGVTVAKRVSEGGKSPGAVLCEEANLEKGPSG